MNIGQRIRSRRVALGMTQDELAKRIGYKSRSSINKIEADGRGLPQNKIVSIASILNTTPAYLMGWTDEEESEPTPTVSGSKWVPVLGQVAAGIPIEAIEDIIGWEELKPERAKTGEFFGLKIKGDSMEPDFRSGDVVIVRQQPDCEDGETAVVVVNSDEATVKRIKKEPTGMMLIPNNHTYEPMFFTAAQIKELPVIILGKVVELRRKY